MGGLNTSSHASKTKRAGWQGILREHFCLTWWEDRCHFTHQFVSCSLIFRAMGNPPTSAAEIDSDPDSPQLDQSPLDQQWFPLGQYHSPHHHLRRPDDRRPGRKGGVSILLSASYRSKAKASCQRLSSGGGGGGGRVVANFVHGKMDGMHCEALLRRPPSESVSTHSSILVLVCRGFSAFWPARFSPSSRPIVIFHLTSFRLVRHDRFFFNLCLLSLSVLSSKVHLHIVLGNPCKTYQHQSVRKR